MILSDRALFIILALIAEKICNSYHREDYSLLHDSTQFFVYGRTYEVISSLPEISSKTTQ